MLKKLDRSVNSQNEIYFVLKNYGHILPDPFPEDLNLYDYCGKLNSLAESYIIYENEKAVALVTGYINDFEKKEAFLQILIVSEEHQGKKYGRKLIFAFIDEAKKKKMNKEFLTVNKKNIRAEKIYAHYGFIDSTKKHNDYNKKIMELNLN